MTNDCNLTIADVQHQMIPALLIKKESEYSYSPASASPISGISIAAPQSGPGEFCKIEQQMDFSHSNQLSRLFFTSQNGGATNYTRCNITTNPQEDASELTGTSNYHLPCPLCDTPLEPRAFRQHLDRHYPRDSPVCPVMQCGRRFAHPNSVRNHMRIKHTIQWAKMKAMRSSGGPFSGIPDFK